MQYYYIDYSDGLLQWCRQTVVSMVTARLGPDMVKDRHGTQDMPTEYSVHAVF